MDDIQNQHSTVEQIGIREPRGKKKDDPFNVEVAKISLVDLNYQDLKKIISYLSLNSIKYYISLSKTWCKLSMEFLLALPFVYDPKDDKAKLEAFKCIECFGNKFIKIKANILEQKILKVISNNCKNLSHLDVSFGLEDIELFSEFTDIIGDLGNLYSLVIRGQILGWVERGFGWGTLRNIKILGFDCTEALEVDDILYYFDAPGLKNLMLFYYSQSLCPDLVNVAKSKFPSLETISAQYGDIHTGCKIFKYSFNFEGFSYFYSHEGLDQKGVFPFYQIGTDENTLDLAGVEKPSRNLREEKRADCTTLEPSKFLCSTEMLYEYYFSKLKLISFVTECGWNNIIRLLKNMTNVIFIKLAFILDKSTIDAIEGLKGGNQSQELLLPLNLTYRATSLSFSMGQYIPDNYLLWVNRCFPHLKDWVIDYDFPIYYLPSSIEESLQFQSLTKFYTEHRFVDSWWLSLTRQSPNLMFIYIPYWRQDYKSIKVILPKQFVRPYYDIFHLEPSMGLVTEDLLPDEEPDDFIEESKDFWSKKWSP